MMPGVEKFPYVHTGGVEILESPWFEFDGLGVRTTLH